MISNIKICHVQFGYFPQQSHTSTYEYAVNLARKGFDVSVIAIAREMEQLSEIVEGVKLHRISIRDFKLRSKFAFLYRARNILFKGNFDIIHVHYTTKGTAALLRLLNSNKSSKWILEIRERKDHLTENLFRIECLFYDAIILLDAQLKSSIFGERVHQNCFEIPLGANFEKFKMIKNKAIRNRIRNNLRITPEETVLIYTGTVDSKRRLDQLIKAFGIAISKQENLKLVIVGAGSLGDDTEMRRLEKMCAETDLKSKVIFTGCIDYEKVPDYLNAADIGVAYVPIVPKFDYQPPLKTVEYLSIELPTIATNTKGNRVFVTDHYNGLLLKDDSSSIAEGILKLVNNKELVKKFVRVSRESVREYDWKNIVESKLVPIYEKILMGT